MSTEKQVVRRIAIAAAFIGTLCALAMGAAGGPWSALSSAVGTLVGLANLWALATLVGRIFDGSAEAQTKKGIAGALLFLKTLALFVIVWLLVQSAWIRGGSFMVGITAVVAAIVVGGLWSGLDSPPDAPHDPDEGKH